MTGEYKGHRSDGTIPNPGKLTRAQVTKTCKLTIRPGLKGFLEAMSEMYEMHVYTMGTRTYAEAICKVVDPEGKFFGSRILSRDESGGE